MSGHNYLAKAAHSRRWRGPCRGRTLELVAEAQVESIEFLAHAPIGVFELAVDFDHYLRYWPVIHTEGHALVVAEATAQTVGLVLARVATEHTDFTRHRQQTSQREAIGGFHVPAAQVVGTDAARVEAVLAIGAQFSARIQGAQAEAAGVTVIEVGFHQVGGGLGVIAGSGRIAPGAARGDARNAVGQALGDA